MTMTVRFYTFRQCQTQHNVQLVHSFPACEALFALNPPFVVYEVHMAQRGLVLGVSCVFLCRCLLLRCIVSSQTELNDGIAMMVGHNNRMQAIISQLEQACLTIEVSTPTHVPAGAMLGLGYPLTQQEDPQYPERHTYPLVHPPPPPTVHTPPGQATSTETVSGSGGRSR